MLYFGSLGKKIVIYELRNNIKFRLRVGTPDKITVLEVWKTNEYIDSDFGIKRDDIVLDIGAHIGAFSILAAKSAANGRVFAYEPNKQNYSLLLENKRLNQIYNLSTFNYAVSDKKGCIELFIGKLSSMHSIYRKNHKGSIKVKSSTLKDVFKTNNLKKVDYLKIDAEGSEYNILLNAPKFILRKVDKIVIEYHDYLNHNFSYMDLKKHLESNGFKVKVGGNMLIRKVLKVGLIKARRPVY